MALSPRARIILRQIALPISLGYSKDEIASRLGRTRRWVNHRLDELRDEIERQIDAA